MADPFLHGVEVIDIDGGARSITIPATSVIGIVGTAPRASMPDFPANTPVLVQNSRALAAKLAAGAPDVPLGTLPDALDSILDQAGASVVVVRVEEGANETETLANVIGGVNAQTGQYEGVHALLAAESITGSKPRLLIAPGFTHVRPADPANPGQFLANPVIAELTGIADRLRATIIADGPDTTRRRRDHGGGGLRQQARVPGRSASDEARRGRASGSGVRECVRGGPDCPRGQRTRLVVVAVESEH